MFIPREEENCLFIVLEGYFCYSKYPPGGKETLTEEKSSPSTNAGRAEEVSESLHAVSQAAGGTGAPRICLPGEWLVPQLLCLPVLLCCVSASQCVSVVLLPSPCEFLCASP